MREATGATASQAGTLREQNADISHSKTVGTWMNRSAQVPSKTFKFFKLLHHGN